MTRTEVKTVAEHFRSLKAAGREVAVLWGAGCSESAGVPLGGNWAATLCQKHGLPHSRDFMQVMAALGNERASQIINEKVKRARVNWAHLALAQLLQADHVRMVATVNFDPLVERTCGILGLSDVAVHDLATYSVFDQWELTFPCLHYLHGKVGGFVKKLTSDQTAKNPLAEKLFNFASDWVWLVIGYGGWNDKLSSAFAKSRREAETYWCIHGNSKLPPDVAAMKPIAVPIRGADEFLLSLVTHLGCDLPDLFWRPERSFGTMTRQCTELNITAGFDLRDYGLEKMKRLNPSEREDNTFHELVKAAALGAPIRPIVERNQSVVAHPSWLAGLSDALLLRDALKLANDMRKAQANDQRPAEEQQKSHDDNCQDISETLKLVSSPDIHKIELAKIQKILDRPFVPNPLPGPPVEGQPPLPADLDQTVLIPDPTLNPAVQDVFGSPVTPVKDALQPEA